MRKVSFKKLGLEVDCTEEQYQKAVFEYLTKKGDKIAKVVKRALSVKDKKLPRNKLEAQLDRVFSVWIRTRDDYTCVICGSKTSPQCGHLIKRGRRATRYDEKNCNCQCASCNQRHNYYPEFYTAWWIAKYGSQEYSKLVFQSKQTSIKDREWYYDMIKKYSDLTTAKAINFKNFSLNKGEKNDFC